MAPARTTRECRLHGMTIHIRRSEGGWRCRQCRIDAVTKRRRRIKEILVAEAGGCCAQCGWNKHPVGLGFHHVEPSQKEFALSQRGVTLSLERARREAAKCILLCHNCHALVEAGVVTLSRLIGDQNHRRPGGITRSGVAKLAAAADC